MNYPEFSGETPQAASPRAAKTAFSRIGMALFVIGGLTMVLQTLFSAVLTWLSMTGSEIADASWTLWAVTFVPLYVIGMPVGILMMRRVPKDRIEENKLSVKEFLIYLLMCFPLMYGGNIIGNLLAALFTGGTAQNGLDAYVFNDSPLSLPVLVFLAPLLEEFLFRKQILDRCSKYGEKTAIVLSATTFALFHMNLYQVFYAFGLGLVFAYVYIRTGRLRYCVALHMIINFMGSALAPWILSQLDMSALKQMESGTIAIDEVTRMLPGLLMYSVYALALLGLSIAGLAILIGQRRKLIFQPAPEELPKGTGFRTVYCNVGMILFAILCLAVLGMNLLLV